MIVVDTSALIAIVKDEPQALACIEAIDKADRVLISAGTLAEVLIVAERKNVWTTMSDFLRQLDLEVIDVDAHTARAIGAVYSVWGKGVHPASLNFGDCFAYALAVQYQCPLLFVGSDFAQTDVASALA
jgi:ribonuclease VapC